MNIVAYAYEAALHCPGCTIRRHQRQPFAFPAEDRGPGDEHNIPLRAVDREGNRVHPIFSTSSDADGEHCDDCREALTK